MAKENAQTCMNVTDLNVCRFQVLQLFNAIAQQRVNSSASSTLLLLMALTELLHVLKMLNVLGH